MNALENKYYSQPRAELLALLPPNSHLQNVLDVGCGAGMAGQLLKEKFDAEKVIGIEKVPEVAFQARQRLDKVLTLDAESPDVPFKENQFDLILLADVLEHFMDPWTILRRYVRFLKPAGLLLLSVPNVQHWRTSISLLFGRWHYGDCGTLDRTHVRFFTIGTARDIIQDMPIKIIKTKYSMGLFNQMINVLTCGLFKGLLTFQIYLLLQKIEEDCQSHVG